MSSEKSVSSVPGGAFLFHINNTHLAWGTDFRHTYVVSRSFEDGIHLSPQKKSVSPVPGGVFLFHINFTHLARGDRFPPHFSYAIEYGTHVSP